MLHLFCKFPKYNISCIGKFNSKFRPIITPEFPNLWVKLQTTKMSTNIIKSKEGEENNSISDSKEVLNEPETSSERSSSYKRGLSPLVDENGFKLRRVHVDAQTMSPYERLGGDKNQDNLQDIPKAKTMREEDEDIEYTIDGPLRRLKPYYFTYMTHCKQRWRDKKLLDVFTQEFRLYPESYYVNAIEQGKVTLNNKVANLDSIIRNGDLISHRMHRHEPPVSSREIKIVYQDDEIIVIDKPSGIPVHPTGRFRHNTITKILEKDYNIKAHPCNRLDRLTSGLMILGKTAKGADKMVKQMREREISKQYIAKVVGEFPLGDNIIVDKPLKTVDPRLAFNLVDEVDGKPAKTIFKRISYDGSKFSLVLCKPLTGRTHQIRVHLQYLGYPIANDPLYSSPLIWGENLGKNGEFDVKEIQEKLNKIGKIEPATSWLHQENTSGEFLNDDVCETCNGEIYTDPGPNDLDLWLHAYKYASTNISTDGNDTVVSNTKNWSYQTALPDWALDDCKKFMELAIEEAKNCADTTTAFSVGAVLVKDNQVLSTGYSRELLGNTHAEQCALEKYFKKTGETDVPPGTVIYTTMEPCSERLSGNLPCTDRILKTNIKTVFVGVMEPDTFIKNNIGYEKLVSHGVSYIHIPGYEKMCLDIAFKGHEKK